MKIIKVICQLIIGGLFIFSGFVKAVDPIGGSIKFEDYFAALHLGFLDPLALLFSILLAAIEFIIGIHILLGIRLKLASWGAIVFMSFFTLLTFYSALANPVSDCGCFGDAWKLTNWETFFKNLIMFPFVLFLFINRKKYTNKLPEWRSVILSSIFIVFIVSVSWYSIKHLPIIDFRPYHIGANIPNSMSVPKDAEQPEYETTFTLEKDGVQKEFDVNNYPYNDSTWVFVDSKSTLIKEGYVPPISDFSLQTINGEIVTQKILENHEPVFLYVIPKLGNANIREFSNLTNLYLKQNEGKYKVYILTSSMTKDIFAFDSKLGIGFDYLIGDETVLKTMVRANPGLLLLYKGTIINKWNFNDIPSVEELQSSISYSISQQNKILERLIVIAMALSLLSIILILYKQKKLN